MADLVRKWYVVRSVGGKENKVKEYIEAEIKALKLTDYVSQVLIPTEKVYSVRNGKKIVRERNFYPGYVLIEAALIGEIPHIIKGLTYVSGFLTDNDGMPIPLRESEVNRILGKVDELAEERSDETATYVVDENVKVTDGPFSGFIGKIEEVDLEKKKLKVMVKIFGRKTPLELSYMQVEKV